MSGFLAVLSVVIFVCLVLVAAIHPVKAVVPRSELKRRAKHSDQAALTLRREQSYEVLSVLFHIVRAVLLLAFISVAVLAYGWLWGVIISFAVAITYPALARLAVVRRSASSLYGKIERSLLGFVERFHGVLRVLQGPEYSAVDAPRKVHSEDDLAELIRNSADIVGKSEQQLISSALVFASKRVSEVMTPRSEIDSIKKAEFLGPLVLDELHALGHSRLPVIDKNLDHVVGVLHLRDLLSLDVKRSVTAEKAMEKRVFYIHEDDSLEHALAAFIKTRHHLFVVINELRETVGLVSLEDVLEALIGRQIVDEDDIHEDLRAVALRKASRNNTPEDHVDL